MRARISDPQGPKIWRVLPYFASLLALAFSFVGPLSGTPAYVLGLFSALAFHAFGVFPLRQRSERAADVVCGPGYIEFTKAGTRNQRVSTKDIIGATTARTEDGLLLTLQHEKRDQPITVRVESDADAEKIRHALGIGHGGFGTIAWRAAADATARQGWVGRLLAAIAFLAIGTLMLWGSKDAALIASVMLWPFAFVGAILGLSALGSKPGPATVVMTAEGIRLNTAQGWFALPYDGMLAVSEHARTIDFQVPPPYHNVTITKSSTAVGGLSQHERSIMFAQVSAAAQRARGLGPPKNDVTGRLDQLRRNGQSARDWLVRLDMQGQMLSAGPGYRGNTLDAEDLWVILEDPEAEAELRTAAARILRHAPQEGTRTRIDAAVAAIRDDATSKRVRIAVDGELDAASSEITYLDATETARAARSG